MRHNRLTKSCTPTPSSTSLSSFTSMPMNVPSGCTERDPVLLVLGDEAFLQQFSGGGEASARVDAAHFGEIAQGHHFSAATLRRVLDDVG